MKLSELVKLCGVGTNYELHDAFDGRMVANSPKSLAKYGSVEVIGFHPRMKTSTDGRLVRVFLYVWGRHGDIQGAKEDKIHADSDT